MNRLTISDLLAEVVGQMKQSIRQDIQMVAPTQKHAELVRSRQYMQAMTLKSNKSAGAI